MDDILTGAVEAVNTLELYTPKAFSGGFDARNALQDSIADAAKEDRATVNDRIAAGQSAEKAMAEFLTDERFQRWYTGLCATLRTYEG